MAGRGWTEKAPHVVGCPLLALAMLVGLPAARARAQVVQSCQPDQYLDRTAAGADRQLTWDFSIVTDPERCLQVRTGQTVVWSGDFDVHPLGGQGGDSPNPIGLHQNGSVTFTTAGTFGFHCLSHSTMIGAIRVVSPPSVPALSPGTAIALTVLLLAGGLLLARNRRGGRRPMRPVDQDAAGAVAWPECSSLPRLVTPSTRRPFTGKRRRCARSSSTRRESCARRHDFPCC